MKQSPQMQEIEKKMQPGVITLHGFLGTDQRNLTDILIEDDALVKRLGGSHEAIAAKMAYLQDKGKEGLGDFISVGPNFEVQVDSVRGKIPCPFGEPGLHTKTNTIVVNKKLKKQIAYTHVHIHLISEHGFYEGKGSHLRLEPEVLIEVLEIEPEPWP